MTNSNEPDKIFIWRTVINSFHYLYGDAEYLHQLAKSPALAKNFERVRLCRTALLLYILSLEALINRAMDHFLPERSRQFILDREEKFSVEDKWLLLALLSGDPNQLGIDKATYPWSHFAELIRIRNEYVHPKHDRYAYYKANTGTRLDCLDWKEIPQGLGIKESDLIYRQTLIPKDPYCILPEHVDEVKRIVDDSINGLDCLLGNKLLKDNWYRSDRLELFYPPGATIADLPREPTT